MNYGFWGLRDAKYLKPAKINQIAIIGRGNSDEKQAHS